MKSYHLQAEPFYRLARATVQYGLLQGHAVVGKYIAREPNKSIAVNVIKNARREVSHMLAAHLPMTEDQADMFEDWFGVDIEMCDSIDAECADQILLKMPRKMPRGLFKDTQEATYTAAHLLAILRHFDHVAAKSIACYPYADAADALWHCTQWDILMPTSNNSYPSPEYKTVLRLFNGEPKI
jgi:hypothetical protein